MQRRVSITIREYKFFRSFSQKFENWPKRKAEALWRKMRERKIAEIEATEACQWLRAAGFPQYAQMYEKNEFPLDLTNVARDHPNLENDPLQSLYRRLCVLNRCSTMRLDTSHKTHDTKKEEDDEENFALSENWTFQPHIRRWSRIGEMGLEIPGPQHFRTKAETSSKDSSPERFESDAYDATGITLKLPTAAGEGGTKLKRSGSERFRDGAKALIRRVESIKTRRKKRSARDADNLPPPSPQHLDLTQIESLRRPQTHSTPPSPAVSPMHSYPKSPLFGHELKVPSQSETFLSPHRLSPRRTPNTPRSMRTSPLHFFAMPHLREGRPSDDSSSYFSDSQESSTGLQITIGRQPSRTRRFLQRSGKVDDIGVHSDSECHGRKMAIKEGSVLPPENKVKTLTRGGSLNLGRNSKIKRGEIRSRSFRSAVGKTPKTAESLGETFKIKRTGGMKWHSFQEAERQHILAFRKCFSQKSEPRSDGIPFAQMSCGQLQIIRKLALVTLTGYMERHCPTHRTGWNWELPKFMTKKSKAPDFKDKRLFGVPLVIILQRSGQTLPVAIRTALRWLQLNALDTIGLFRKPGVRTRIAKLKERLELAEGVVECMELYDSQQAYDVADMLKLYFRELPEPLLTTKMSETFIAIFQHLPSTVRSDAVQSAILLLPDENRETLYAILEFLTLLADNSHVNQMNANNLAVCLAPTFFHNTSSSGPNSVSASPRKKKPNPATDGRELLEAKASHECLAFMIEHFRSIYTVAQEKLTKCNFGYMEESRPVPLEVLGKGMEFQNWRGYMTECVNATFKEGKEKPRNWISMPSPDSNVEIACKKVGDGHPLRLWRCTAEIEGFPRDVMNHILLNRATWDQHLLHSQTIKILDEHSDIHHFCIDGQVATDFCVLRSWQSDTTPTGTCVVVETSIDHPKAKPLHGSVRGVVLASRYLIESTSNGRSKVMQLSRIDVKGKTPEWYHKNFGHILSHYLLKIKDNFRFLAEA